MCVRVRARVCVCVRARQASLPFPRSVFVAKCVWGRPPRGALSHCLCSPCLQRCSLPPDLLVANVKPCLEEQSRPYCFYVISIERKYLLQAEDEQDMSEWLSVIQVGLLTFFLGWEGVIGDLVVPG